MILDPVRVSVEEQQGLLDDHLSESEDMVSESSSPLSTTQTQQPFTDTAPPFSSPQQIQPNATETPQHPITDDKTLDRDLELGNSPRKNDKGCDGNCTAFQVIAVCLVFLCVAPSIVLCLILFHEVERVDNLLSHFVGNSSHTN